MVLRARSASPVLGPLCTMTPPWVVLRAESGAAIRPNAKPAIQRTVMLRFIVASKCWGTAGQYASGVPTAKFLSRKWCKELHKGKDEEERGEKGHAEGLLDRVLSKSHGSGATIRLRGAGGTGHRGRGRPISRPGNAGDHLRRGGGSAVGGHRVRQRGAGHRRLSESRLSSRAGEAERRGGAGGADHGRSSLTTTIDCIRIQTTDVGKSLIRYGADDRALARSAGARAET